MSLSVSLAKLWDDGLYLPAGSTAAFADILPGGTLLSGFQESHVVYSYM